MENGFKINCNASTWTTLEVITTNIRLPTCSLEIKALTCRMVQAAICHRAFRNRTLCRTFTEMEYSQCHRVKYHLAKPTLALGYMAFSLKLSTVMSCKAPLLIRDC